MSRAFVKEDGPDTAPLPDLPLSPHPNYVTPRGLRLLQAAHADRIALLRHLKSRPDRLDLQPEKAAERDLRYLDARLRSAILVVPDPAPLRVAFATCVTVADGEGNETTYTIVGEDEADAAAGRIAPQSPLARALIGAEVGDSIEWRRPGGVVSLEVTAIAPAE